MDLINFLKHYPVFLLCPSLLILCIYTIRLRLKYLKVVRTQINSNEFFASKFLSLFSTIFSSDDATVSLKISEGVSEVKKILGAGSNLNTKEVFYPSLFNLMTEILIARLRQKHSTQKSIDFCVQLLIYREQIVVLANDLIPEDKKTLRSYLLVVDDLILSTLKVYVDSPGHVSSEEQKTLNSVFKLYIGEYTTISHQIIDLMEREIALFRPSKETSVDTQEEVQATEFVSG